MDIQDVDVLVIGAGAIGLSIAWELAKLGRDVIVLEREAHVGSVQSARNSGVIHAGIYYEPGSWKARTCKTEHFYEFCRTYGVPHKQTGNLIVARTMDELEVLGSLERQAALNGVKDCLLLGGAGVRKYEPNIQALAALYDSVSGIVDVASYVVTLKRLCQGLGVIILTKTNVDRIFLDTFPVVHATEASGNELYIRPKILVNAAGLDAARIARMVNPGNPWNYALTRGEYVSFNMRKRSDLALQGHLIYPIPCVYQGSDGKEYTSLGIHLTPTFQINGHGEYEVGPTILIGPSAKPVHDALDYEKDRYPIRHFIDRVSQFFSTLQEEDCELSYSGIVARFAAPHRDFVIEKDSLFPNCIHLVGIDSPGLTASLAIGEEVSKLAHSI